MEGRHERAAQLRAVLGAEPTEATLYELLAHNQDDVERCVNAYFDPQAPAAQSQTAQTPTSEQQLFQVTVPAGSVEGSTIHVQTPSGLMQVQVPAGLSSGDNFLLRLPPSSTLPVGSAVPAAAYPGASHQPRVNVVHRQPVVVHAHPYGRRYGYGYGYRYGDPFLYGGVGMLGGMLVADALFW